MSAENIISLIKKDAEKEIKKIHNDAEKQAEKIIKNAKEEAKAEAEKILKRGMEQSENLKKILISKANQDVKRDIMRVKEEIIEDCFNKAFEKTRNLDESSYRSLLISLINEGKRKLGEEYELIITRDTDRKIVEELGLKVTDKINASGGILIKSSDGKLTLDNTLEGIMKRKKETIRVNVGKLLFS